MMPRPIVLLLCVGFSGSAFAQVPQFEVPGPQFKVIYEAPGLELRAGRAMRYFITEPFNWIAQELNQRYIVRAYVPIHVRTCRKDGGAFYNPADRSITVCLEFDSFLSQLVGDTAAAKPLMEFILLHEVGHALIDLLQLPITGREEDAADQFATVWFTSRRGTYDDRVVRGAVAGFHALARVQVQNHAAFAGEHSLSIQRAINIMCWVYGYDRGKWAGLVSNDGLTPARAVRCPNEYTQASRSWDELLRPHLRHQ